MRRVLRVTLALLGIFTAVAVYCGFAAARHALTAEHHLHAMRNVVRGCHSYVAKNNGEWPKSWPDVLPLLPDDRDWDEQELVTIDFSADPAELATQDWGSFTGIQVKPPVFPSYRNDLKALIELLRQQQLEIGE